MALHSMRPPANQPLRIPCRISEKNILEEEEELPGLRGGKMPPPMSSSSPNVSPLSSMTSPMSLADGPDGDRGKPSWATERGAGSDASSTFTKRRRSFAPQLSTPPPLQIISTPLPLNQHVDALKTDLLPVLSPVAMSSSAAHAPDRPYWPGQPKSLSGIAVRAFCLGVALALSAVATLAFLAYTSSPVWRLPFFVGCLSTFHFLEFLTTAEYNTPAATVDSFLLTANWPTYAIAHAAACVECLVVSVFFPRRAWAPLHTGPLLLLAGLGLVVVGQTVRSAAMVQAGQSFNHTVQVRRRESHQLVTTGIYATLRHPSYFGFFWWALGTQLVLGNVVCFVAYSVVLWRFFSSRIRHEEESLVVFFPGEYQDYRRTVGTKIPFIP